MNRGGCQDRGDEFGVGQRLEHETAYGVWNTKPRKRTKVAKRENRETCNNVAPIDQ